MSLKYTEGLRFDASTTLTRTVVHPDVIKSGMIPLKENGCTPLSAIHCELDNRAPALPLRFESVHSLARSPDGRMLL